MQDYCFSPNIYTASQAVILTGHSSSTADTTARFAMRNDTGAARNYHVRWRYMTATDEPFIYAIRDKNTGEILHLWACDDPPAGFWGLDTKPDNFVPPIILSGGLGTELEEIVLFKQNKDFVIELGEKAVRDKKLPFQVLSEDWEYNKSKKIFERKNLK